MKKVLTCAILILGVSLTGSVCDSSSGGGGGGMFDMSGMGGGGVSTWDMILMLTSPAACDKSFAESGAGLMGLLPGSMIPGPAVTFDGYEFDADIPEIHMLGYAVVAPGMVNAGDAVKVHFRYQAAADGQNGDYFLTRIIDGNRFRVPARAYYGSMARNEPVDVNFTYTAGDAGFGLEFIVGLSDPDDAFYLDDLEVTVNGAPFFADYFEEGDYTVTGNPDGSEAVMRVAFIPNNPVGTFGLQPTVPLEGAQSLEITGGRHYQLIGWGGSFDGYTGLMLNLIDPDILAPFYGEVQAAEMEGLLVGNYLAWNKPIYVPDDPTYCAESGQAVIASNVTGSADISGSWTLILSDVTCEETDLAGDPIVIDTEVAGVMVSRLLTAYIGYPFSLYGEGGGIDFSIGFTLDEMGMVNLFSGAMQAQLLGVFYETPPADFPYPVPPGNSVFVGEVMGALPSPEGGTCTVTAGSFIAIIDGTVFVPPPDPGDLGGGATD